MPQYLQLVIVISNFFAMQLHHSPFSIKPSTYATCISQHYSIFKVTTIACSTLGTRCISWLIMAIYSRNVSIRISINLAHLIRRVENQTLSTCTIQISTYHFQIQLMIMLLTEHITCTKIHRIRDVCMCVSGEIQHHVNHTNAAELINRP